MNSKTLKVLSIFSVVGRIVGIILGFTPFRFYVGIPLSIASIVLAAISLNAIAKGAGASKGLAVRGLVYGICGVVFCAPVPTI